MMIAEADLQLRVLVEIVEDDLGLLAALSGKTMRMPSRSLSSRGSSCFELLLIDEGGDVFDQLGLVDLIRQLIDD